MRSGHYFNFIEQNGKVLHRNCTTHGYSRRTRSTLFIVRVEGLGPGWCGIYREGWGVGSMLVRNVWEMRRFGNARTGVER